MAKSYYYFISSLPELRLGDVKEPYRVAEFKGELNDVLSASHGRLVDDLLGFYDHANLLDLLLGQEYNMLASRGRWEKEEIVLRLGQEETGLGEETDAFLAEVRRMKAEGPADRASVEGRLMALLYERMLGHENLFIRQYFRFDLDLRNILTALNARRHHLDEAPLLETKTGFVFYKLKSSSPADFGLAGEVDYISRLVEIFELGDLVATEQFVDGLRWAKIESLNTFVYFGIEVVLGHLLKLMMCERWVGLEPRRGAAVLEERIKIGAVNLV